ncbi:MAG TPA: TrbI/VirB10 family protein, partial [Myxococcota bacterium]|nr:TrbI/VirB10 family protein [Myxococcota bacterium]
MKLAMRLPERSKRADSDADPRDGASAEIIDLASRTAYPVVAQRKGRSDALGLAAGVGVVALLGAATLWGLNASRVDGEQAAQPQVQPAAPLPDLGAPPAEAALAAETQLVAPAAPAPTAVYAAQPNYAPVPAANPFASPTVVFDASALPVPAGAFTPVTPEGAAVAAPGGGAAGDFASRVGGVGGAPAQARSDVDPRTTITPGTMIPAVLETAINTDVPGYVRAVVSQDVRSFDGT